MTLTDTATVLGVAAAVLLFTALVLAFAADGTHWSLAEPKRTLAWIAFGLSMTLTVAATWVAVLA
jgi:hypothetical protein